jgi:hypothetical protein
LWKPATDAWKVLISGAAEGAVKAQPEMGTLSRFVRLYCCRRDACRNTCMQCDRIYFWQHVERTKNFPKVEKILLLSVQIVQDFFRTKHIPMHIKSPLR